MTNREYAERLRRKIRSFWVQRGYHAPNINLEDGQFIQSARGRVVELRSDMVGGLPRHRASAPRVRRGGR